MESLLFCASFTSPDAGLWTGTVPPPERQAVSYPAQELSRELHKATQINSSQSEMRCVKQGGGWVGVSMSGFEHLNFSMHWPVSSRPDTEIAIWEKMPFSKYWVWGKQVVEQARRGPCAWPIWENKLNKDPRKFGRKSWKESFTAP